MKLRIDALVLLALVATSVSPVSAATIVIINNDGPNEGFNDPAIVSPVGGNPGTTVGAQRLNVRQAMRDMGWFNGTSITGVPASPPQGVELRSAPNPFGTSAAITFTMPRAGGAMLDVFGVDGRRVRRLEASSLPAGVHQVVWDGLDDAGARVPGGVYLFRLRAPELDAKGRTVRLP
jgi:hypothetical protein